MKGVIELLARIIAHETKYVESMRQTLKEDEFTILRLQNKARVLEIEIGERKQLIKEYRGYLRDISEAADTSMKLVPSIKNQLDTKSSSTEIKLMKSLEKQA